MSPPPSVRISVAMATWNGAAYLPEQLFSLAKQELLPSELVVLDDASSDDTLEILAEFARTAPFPVCISRNPGNLGIRSTFEKAISLCKGEIVFLCDQDDYWAPGKIRRVVEAFEGDPATMAVLNDKTIADERLSPSPATVLGNIRQAGAPDTAFIAGCCSAYRREWLAVALPIPQTLFHDWWLGVLAHQLGVSHILDEPLQLYRRHDTNASVHPHYSRRRRGEWTRARGLLRAFGRDRAAALRDFWEKDLAAHGEIAVRIEEKLPVLALMGLELRAREALARLRVRDRVARARLAAIGSPWHRRAGLIWKLWRSGGYAHFSGWRSAAKDFIR